MFLSGFQDPHYYDGTYTMGQMTNHYAVDKYFAANPSVLPLDVAATRGGSDPNNFDLIERVSAGYIMNTINWDRLRLQTGLRLEATHELANGFLVNLVAGPNGDGLDNNGNWIGTTPTSNTQSYIDPLPSIQARYAITASTNVRAVYARGISRPNQYDLVPYITDSGAGDVPRYAIGNPNEQPTHANNYDLLFQQELKPFGLIEAGFFYKQLADPIVTAYVPYGVGVNAALATQNINGSNATVSGLEFSWQQKFTNLPGELRGLGMMANYSYNNSHINGLPNRSDSPTLLGAARHAFNLEPAYELKRYSVHMGITYNGSNVYAYQYINNAPTGSGLDTPGPINGPLGDNYFYPHLQVDTQMSARIYRGLQLQVEGLNLTNEVFGFYNGSEQYMTQREYYKPTYSASLRYDFGAESKHGK
jgi:TonB-dependent receptor